MPDPRDSRSVAQGVAGAMLITAYITGAGLWIEGWYVAMRAVLHTHSRLAILAVVLALFCLNALLGLFIASGFDGGLLSELFGCQWGPQGVATADDNEQCERTAVQIVVIHDGDAERAFKLCAEHRDRVLQETVPHA